MRHHLDEPRNWKEGKIWTDKCGCENQGLHAETKDRQCFTTQVLKYCKEHKRIAEIRGVTEKLNSEKENLEEQIRERT